jgi:AcrR family transcriptional regulator
LVTDETKSAPGSNGGAPALSASPPSAATETQAAANDRRVGRPTAEETERLNEQILQAALDVFLREGFGGASIEQIAQESRTTRRTILNRFHDKGSLFIAVLEMALWRFQKRITPPESMQGAKPLDTLREWCRLMLENVVLPEQIEIYRLSLSHLGKFPAITVAAQRWNDSLLADLEAIVRRAQQSGAFAGRDPATLATGMIGVFISNPVNRAALGDPQFRDPVRRRQYFDTLWKLIQDSV